MDRAAEFDHARVVLVAGCSLAEASVGPVLLVVRDEFIEEASELALVPDQGPVQQFVANGAHPSLSERVGLWCARWSGDDWSADRGERTVEGSAELAGAIADHEPERVVVAHEEVAGGLSSPGPGGIGGDAGEVDPAAVHPDEEQDVESAQRDGVDTEEVGGDQHMGLACDELAAGWPGAVRGGLASCVAQDPPHRGGSAAVPESSQFSVDAPVPPVWVLGIETQHESA